MALLDVLVTTAAGALSASAGVLLGGFVTRRGQDRQWSRDRQLEVCRELLGHYAAFATLLKRAHADRTAWDYDWAEWSAVLTRVGLVAPADVAAEADRFGRAVDTFLDRVARTAGPLRAPLTEAEFLAAGRDVARAQVRLVNAMRRPLGHGGPPLARPIGGSHTDA
ncbi:MULTISPECIES: hypothetical protein [Kitasatospora]|uniref:Uncharacterized protein n=1 Tax=Kitasatospora setae (strain ATCC 33774 / DSM 43861 / JCM 3304 / KCC A-0304 / NBRC 14216 / KM-6054) TaxID=452652 RepID=E4N6F9_KITSK|nr:MULTISPECIES: hypothetical protein [Kitasatospora]BAJ26790.1 hypothetical protein KSE_09530 [Kitasatospora setae KM-6054]